MHRVHAGASEATSAEDAWVAIAHGALDVSATSGFKDGTELLVVPTVPMIPLALTSVGARIWRRLIEGPVADGQLDEMEREVVREMRESGIASPDPSHPCRVTAVAAPWMSSPMHELVYALVARLAAEAEVPCVFVKGPMLHDQGLRAGEHSADVDVWTHPRHVRDFVRLLAPWGWTEQPNAWDGTIVNHSTTLEPTHWGCEIDVHRRMPGLTRSDEEAFEALATLTRTVTFAGVQAQTPRLDTSAVLHGLHALRPHVGRLPQELVVHDVVRVLRLGGDSVVEVAEALGAGAVLQEPLRAAMPGVEVAVEGAPRDWAWRGERSKAIGYLVALRELPFRQRIRVAFRLVWPSSRFVLSSERISGGRETSVLRARMRRLGRGIRSLGRSQRRGS